MSEIVKVGNNDIPVIEWKGQVVITTAQLAKAYGANEQQIQQNFNNHEDNFIEKKHYYLLIGQELKEFKRYFDNIEEAIGISKFTSKLYLWTERGANRHCKILDTDKAWEQFDNLEETYFNVKKNSINRSQLSESTQALFGLIESVARQELEQKRQAEQLNRIEQKQETIVQTFSKGAGEQETTQWVNHCITKIAESPNFMFTFGNRYAAARNESYQRLTTKAGCRLDQKVRNAIARAEEKGSTQAQKNNINKLTVIMADRRLKEIYVGVIKEMMIAYCVEASVKGVQA